VDGVTYVGSDDGKLYAFDAGGVIGCAGTPKSCTPVWTATTGGSVVDASVANGTVYANSFDKHLYAFDARGVTGCFGVPKSCTPLWTASAGFAVGPPGDRGRNW
jgi:outer membrane protein assembly factor BamB